MSDWTEELRQEVVDAYVAQNPTPENTVQIMEDIQKDTGKSINAIRTILSKAKVYVCKTPVAKAKSDEASDKKPRVSKEDKINALSELLEANGVEADEAILSKLTGKAADYFTTVVQTLLED